MTDTDRLLREKQRRIEGLLKCRPGETGLLIIDMQRGFCEEGAALAFPEAHVIIPNVRRLIAAAREAGIPITYTRFIYDPDRPNLRGDPFGPEHLPYEPGADTGFGLPSGNCIPGEMGPNSPAIITDLEPRVTDMVIDGHTYDKFIGTNLDASLRERGIRYLIIAGVVTDLCVHTTLCTASQLDYRVTAVTDAVATLWPRIQDACFDVWQRKFARLVTTKQVIEELANLSGSS